MFSLACHWWGHVPQNVIHEMNMMLSKHCVLLYWYGGLQIQRFTGSSHWRLQINQWTAQVFVTEQVYGTFVQCAILSECHLRCEDILILEFGLVGVCQRPHQAAGLVGVVVNVPSVTGCVTASIANQHVTGLKTAYRYKQTCTHTGIYLMR